MSQGTNNHRLPRGEKAKQISIGAYTEVVEPCVLSLGGIMKIAIPVIGAVMFVGLLGCSGSNGSTQESLSPAERFGQAAERILPGAYESDTGAFEFAQKMCDMMRQNKQVGENPVVTAQSIMIQAGASPQQAQDFVGLVVSDVCPDAA